MTNDKGSTNAQMTRTIGERLLIFGFRHSFGRRLRHSSLSSGLIALVPVDRATREIDRSIAWRSNTEADSLHVYREKLCRSRSARQRGQRPGYDGARGLYCRSA